MSRIAIAVFTMFAASAIVACGGESSASATETATSRQQDALASTYELLLLDQVGTLNDSLTRFIALSNADPSTAGWIDDITSELELWQSTAASARDLTPPQRYDELHTTYLTAMDHFERAATDFLAGMQSGDQVLMNAGIQTMLEGVDWINRTRELVPD